MNAPLPTAAAASAKASASSATSATSAGTAPASPLAPAAAPMLQLQLSLDDVNLLLEAVGALPFARVYALVGRIQAQAAAQLQAGQG